MLSSSQPAQHSFKLKKGIEKENGEITDICLDNYSQFWTINNSFYKPLDNTVVVLLMMVFYLWGTAI